MPHPDRVDPGGPAVPDRVLALGPAPADLVLAGQGDRVELTGLVAAVVLVLPRLVGRAVPVELVLVGQGDRVELMGLVAAVVLVLPRLVGRAVPVGWTWRGLVGRRSWCTWRAGRPRWTGWGS